MVWGSPKPAPQNRSRNGLGAPKQPRKPDQKLLGRAPKQTPRTAQKWLGSPKTAPQNRSRIGLESPKTIAKNRPRNGLGNNLQKQPRNGLGEPQNSMDWEPHGNGLRPQTITQKPFQKWFQRAPEQPPKTAPEMS